MQFANLGAKLILSARNKDELERVKQNILSKYGNYFWCCINFSFRGEVVIWKIWTMFHLLFKGKNPDSRVEVLPMDLSAGEESLKEIVHAAESLFCNAGVDYMIHNAAFERPVNNTLILFYHFNSLSL